MRSRTHFDSGDQHSGIRQAMRVAFVAYLAIILAALAYASVIGLTHH